MKTQLLKTSFIYHSTWTECFFFCLFFFLQQLEPSKKITSIIIYLRSQVQIVNVKGVLRRSSGILEYVILTDNKETGTVVIITMVLLGCHTLQPNPSDFIRSSGKCMFSVINMRQTVNKYFTRGLPGHISAT